MAQQRIELLRRDCGCRQRHIDANGAGRAHGMRGVANEHQAMAGPIFDQDDLAFERDEWLEVLETGGEISEDGVQTTHAFGHPRNAGLPPVLPRARWQTESRLNMLGILRQQETLDL